MVGAGLLTFMLTGGPEEFPSVDPNEGEFSRDDEGDEYNNDEYEEGVSADLETPTNSTPIWVDEVGALTCFVAVVTFLVFCAL